MHSERSNGTRVPLIVISASSLLNIINKFLILYYVYVNISYITKTTHLKRVKELERSKGKKIKIGLNNTLKYTVDCLRF